MGFTAIAQVTKTWCSGNKNMALRYQKHGAQVTQTWRSGYKNMVLR